VVEKRVRLDRSVPLGKLVGSITALPGLGPWTAHYIALRMGEPDALPTSDLGLRRALVSRGAAAVLPSADQLAAVAEAWRPWRALAAVHLWSSGRPALETPA
jgi:3-methyladenine DNA glycosylase/8-oxoguanine DNA glycosylase